MQISYEMVSNVCVRQLAVPLTFNRVPLIHVSKVLILLVKETKTEKSNTKPLQSSQGIGRFLRFSKYKN